MRHNSEHKKTLAYTQKPSPIAKFLFSITKTTNITTRETFSTITQTYRPKDTTIQTKYKNTAISCNPDFNP